MKKLFFKSFGQHSDNSNTTMEKRPFQKRESLKIQRVREILKSSVFFISAILAVSLLSMTACKKDKDNDNNNNPVNTDETDLYVVLSEAGLMVQKTDITGNSPANWQTVNSLCENSTIAGYTDWRLPTKDELAVLYNNRIVIGGFKTSGSNSDYWSSTVYSSSSHWHWGQDFISGGQGNIDDNSNSRGRCVRNY